LNELEPEVVPTANIQFFFDANIESGCYIVASAKCAADSYTVFTRRTEEAYHSTFAVKQHFYGSCITAANRSNKLLCYILIFQLLKNIVQVFFFATTTFVTAAFMAAAFVAITAFVAAAFVAAAFMITAFVITAFMIAAFMIAAFMIIFTCTSSRYSGAASWFASRFNVTNFHIEFGGHSYPPSLP
jgi:hypothetical protein